MSAHLPSRRKPSRRAQEAEKTASESFSGAGETTMISRPSRADKAGPRYEGLRLNDVLQSPFQPRLRPLTKGDVAELMAAIEAAGQLTPIIVSPAKDEPGKFHVHSGHRRCAALRFLGRDEVRAEVRPELTAREARKIALVDNLGREDLTAYEQAVALRDYAAENDIGFEAAAKELGIARRTAYRLKPILDASADLRTTIRDGAINAKTAELLVKLEKRNARKALRLGRALAEGAASARDVERALESSKSPKRAVAKKPVELKIDEHAISLRVNVARANCKGEQRDRLLDALQQILGALEVPHLKAVAPQMPGERA